MMKLLYSLIFGLSLVGLAGCSNGDRTRCNGAKGANALDGSYCEDIPLEFTEVKIKSQDAGGEQFVTIEYLDAEVNSVNPLKTLSFLFNASATEIMLDTEIDLQMISAQVRRFPSDATQPIDLTGDLEPTSNMMFQRLDRELGGTIKGEFHLLFTTGRTLNGFFESVVVDARPMGDG